MCKHNETQIKKRPIGRIKFCLEQLEGYRVGARGWKHKVLQLLSPRSSIKQLLLNYWLLNVTNGVR
jgi:hypothetical protein